MNKFSVVKFSAAHAAAFANLNKEWIETYFRLEEMDLKQLEDPFESIIKPGGEIFVIESADGHVVGVCAMIPHEKNSYELAKMAVSPIVRGQGVGDFLMETVIQWAQKQNASSIMLLSNTKLEPAISLYKKHGFVTVKLGPHPDYERCNIEMKLDLQKSTNDCTGQQSYR
jgi:N-acetylglutamate synthase-like GNAT family acetyltransferase